MQYSAYAKRIRRGQILSNIAQSIRDIRKKKKWSQLDLAKEMIKNDQELIELSKEDLDKKIKGKKAVIARLEGLSNTRMPSIDLLSDIAEATGIKLDISCS